MSGDLVINGQRDMSSMGNKEPESAAAFVGLGGVVFAILAIGSVIAAYFASPSFHAFANKAVNVLENGKMSTEILLYSVGAITLVGLATKFAISFYKKHQERQQGLSLFNALSPRKEYYKTLKLLVAPTRKQLIISSIAFSLFLALVLSSALIFSYVPSVHSALSKALAYKLPILPMSVLIAQYTAIVFAILLSSNVQRPTESKRQTIELKPVADNMYFGIF